MKTVKVLVTLFVGMSSLSSAVAAAEPDLTMKATADGVVVTGKDFTATAAEASFISAKGLFIFKGTPQKPVTFTRTSPVGDESTMSGQVIEYVPKRKEARATSVSGQIHARPRVTP